MVLHGILGESSLGRVCGAKLLAGTLRCLRLCWRLPWDWSDEEQLGRCPKPQQGRCPCTLQGTSSLDPFARFSWFRDHTVSACLSTTKNGIAHMWGSPVLVWRIFTCSLPPAHRSFLRPTQWQSCALPSVLLPASSAGSRSGCRVRTSR